MNLIFSKKTYESKRMQSEHSEINETKEKKYTKKDLYKKSLKLKTEEDEDEEYSSEEKKDILQNLISEINDKRTQYTNKPKKINDLILGTDGLPTKIKIYKCVIYKNTEPDLTEEMIKDIIHKRNKSQGINNSFIIKLPKGMYLDDEVKEEKIIKKKKYGKKRIRGSKSTAAL